MEQSFGSWMLTGGTRGELHEEARQQEHVSTFRELGSERRAARRSQRSAAMAHALNTIRARFAVTRSDTTHSEATPDCCPA
jgi:hypothetical protein